MDRKTLNKANDIVSKIDHYQWFSTEIIVRKNAGKNPMTVRTGIDMCTELIIEGNDFKELSEIISCFLDNRVRALEKELKEL